MHPLCEIAHVHVSVMQRQNAVSDLQGAALFILSPGHNFIATGVLLKKT